MTETNDSLEDAARYAIEVLTAEFGSPRPPTIEDCLRVGASGARARRGGRGRPKKKPLDKRALRRACLRLMRALEARARARTSDQASCDRCGLRTARNALLLAPTAERHDVLICADVAACLERREP